MPDADPDRLVECIKLGKTLPGLKRAPFPTDLGKMIHEKVSKEAWDLWLAESVRYINTYRVDLSSKQGTEFMIKQLKIWLGMEDGELAATAWTPEQGGPDPSVAEDAPAESDAEGE